MIHTKLPYNHVLEYMRYDKEIIYLGFKKPRGIIVERSYNVNKLLAYKLFYSKSSAECLQVYNEIKKESKFITSKLT